MCFFEEKIEGSHELPKKKSDSLPLVGIEALFGVRSSATVMAVEPVRLSVLPLPFLVAVLSGNLFL